MPTYKVTDPDTGRTVRLTGDSPPTEAELTEVFAQLGQPKQDTPPNQLSLPGRERTRKAIGERRDILTEMSQSPMSMLMSTTPVGMMQTGSGLLQRLESSIAGPAMALQEGRGGDLLKELISGVSGKKSVELGDIMRNVNVPEPLAIATGMFAMSGVMNAMTGGAFTKDVTRAAKEGVPKVMGKKFTLERAGQAADEMEEVRTQLGRTVDSIARRHGNVEIDPRAVNIAVKKLPETVQKTLNKDIYKIERLSNGDIAPTIKNMRRVQKALQDHMTARAWEESTKMAQQVTKRTYGVVRRAIGKAAPELDEPMKAYSDYMDVYREVTRTVKDAQGFIREKRLRGAFKPGAEKAYLEAWDKASKLSPKLNQIMQDMTRFTRREALKQTLRRVGVGAGLAIGGGIAGALGINRLLRGGGGGE